MQSTDSQRRIEIPVDLSAALTQVAAARGLPTTALATIWLTERLRCDYPDIRINPNTYRYRAMHYRRWDATTYAWGPPMPPLQEDVAATTQDE
jgi:hypothetical protein